MAHAISRARRRLITLISLAATLFLAVGIVPAAHAATGSISGTVLSPAAQYVPNRFVTAYPAAGGGPVAAVSTDLSGNYTLSGLPAGDYKVEVTYGSVPNPPVWNGNAVTAAAAPAITVADGASVTGENITLPLHASISGTVTESGAVNGPVAGAAVRLTTDAGIPVANTSTGADGSYSFSGQAGGAYKVQVTWPVIYSQTAWYGGATATVISVAPDAAVAGKDVVFSSRGAVSGKVTGYSGTAPVTIKAYPANDPSVFGTPPINSATVASDGSYVIGGLPAGSVKVFFDGAAVGVADQWYQGGTPLTTPAIPVTLGQVTPGIDFTTTAGATISGQIKAPYIPGNTMVDLFDPSGKYVTTGFSKPDGSYSIAGLSPGSYVVKFSMFAASGPTVSWYGGTSQATAAVLVVGAGQTVTGINSDVVTAPPGPIEPVVPVVPVSPPVPVDPPSVTAPAVQQAAAEQPAAQTSPSADPSPSVSVTPESASATETSGELPDTGASAALVPMGLVGGALSLAGLILLSLKRRTSRR